MSSWIGGSTADACVEALVDKKWRILCTLFDYSAFSEASRCYNSTSSARPAKDSEPCTPGCILHHALIQSHFLDRTTDITTTAITTSDEQFDMLPLT